MPAVKFEQIMKTY